MRRRPDLIALCAIVCCLTPVSVGTGACGAFSRARLLDDFNDNRTNAGLWRPRIEGVGPTVAEANRRVEMSLPPGSSGELFRADYCSVCALHGDFDIQVDYRLLEWPTTNGARAGLVL